MTRELASTAVAYAELTKPRVLLLVIFTGLPALILAAGAWPAPEFALAVLAGIALAAAADRLAGAASGAP